MVLTTTYTSPKVEVKNSPIEGKGVFAREGISRGEIVFDFSTGTGKMINTKEMDALVDKGQDYGIQVGDDLFFAATEASEMESGDYLNHSCDANCGIKDLLKIVAMRDILPSEEVVFDYAMSESSLTLKMECHCGASKCRGVVTGNDWKIKELQERYKGYFSDYLQKKIKGLQYI